MTIGRIGRNIAHEEALAMNAKWETKYLNQGKNGERLQESIQQAEVNEFIFATLDFIPKPRETE